MDNARSLLEHTPCLFCLPQRGTWYLVWYLSCLPDTPFTFVLHFQWSFRHAVRSSPASTSQHLVQPKEGSALAYLIQSTQERSFIMRRPARPYHLVPSCFYDIVQSNETLSNQRCANVCRQLYNEKDLL